MSELTVETCSGKVRGCVEQSILGEDYHAFKGIPYAKPPVGELRFQDPVPVSPWNDVRNCTNFGPVCQQSDWFTKEISGSDDCLYLNVYYALKSKDKLLKPVMVWIHGGAFACGSGNDDFYGPDYLIHKDIVLVTINYRLGVLGFLNLDSEIAPGNQGLKDQVMALRWIRDNISNFGGNPQNVTIFGESAGGASVHYLTLSPLAKGLFHQAIIQSGVVLNPWSFNTSDQSKDHAYRLCEILGKKTKDEQEIVDFLRTIDSHRLIEAQENCLTPLEKMKLIFPFAPGTDANSKNPFMPVHPFEAAKQGVQVPLMIGCTGREGIMFYEMVKEGLMNTLPRDYSNCLRSNVDGIMKNYGQSMSSLKRFYFDNEELNEDNKENVADLMGDMNFVEGTHRAIKIQVEKSAAPTYFYRYTNDKTPSLLKAVTNVSLKGASHGDELQYLFRPKKFEQSHQMVLKEGTVRYGIMQRMVELWVNFATTGRPTPTTSKLIPFYWQPVVSDSVLRYLNICEDIRMDVTLNLGNIFSCHKIPKVGI
ncbi:hypothetical protein QAD02_018662 [Eretmocerus hayati]|uniref:Uncharacterized protein n=1 Tax=Eretmocerus hayati TaxID=131215 RepID=A0ACC2PH12_9HYME|nr:hypothetical protein QAD02_018662 [Eretmocerus hayati]